MEDGGDQMEYPNTKLCCLNPRGQQRELGAGVSVGWVGT